MKMKLTAIFDSKNLTSYQTAVAKLDLPLLGTLSQDGLFLVIRNEIGERVGAVEIVENTPVELEIPELKRRLAE